MCVCVCVKERERERARQSELRESEGIYTYMLVAWSRSKPHTAHPQLVRSSLSFKLRLITMEPSCDTTGVADLSPTCESFSSSSSSFTRDSSAAAALAASPLRPSASARSDSDSGSATPARMHSVPSAFRMGLTRATAPPPPPVMESNWNERNQTTSSCQPWHTSA